MKYSQKTIDVFNFVLKNGHTEVVELLKKAGADYDDAFLFFNRGIRKADAGDYEGAIGDYTRAIESDPDNPRIYFSRGYAQSSIGEYEESIADFARVIEIMPENADAYNMLGWNHIKLERYKDVLSDLNKALSIEERASFYDTRAWVLHHS